MEEEIFSLHEAVRLNQLDLVRDILESDASGVNDWDIFLETPLCKVYKHVDFDGEAEMRLKMAQLLIDYGADVNAQSGHYFATPLYNAILVNEVTGINFLLQYNTDVNVLDFVSKSIVHCMTVNTYAVKDDAYNIVQLLLQNGANPNVVDTSIKSPVVCAAFTERLDILQLLLDAGAKTLYLHLALIIGCRRKNSALVKFLIKHRHRLDAHVPSKLKPVYLKVCKSEGMNEDSIGFFEKILYYEGITVNRLKIGGEEMTDLHLAVEAEDESRVIFLLRKGAKVDARNVYGNTPLLYALEKKWMAPRSKTVICRFLIMHGADLDARNYLNKTPIQLAVEEFNIKLVNLILAQKTGIEERKLPSDEKSDRNFYNLFVINRNARLGYYVYELAVAIVLGYEVVVDRLIGRGCKSELGRDSRFLSKSPFYFSLESRQYNITKMLLDAEFRIDDKYFCPFTPMIDLMTCHDDDIELACLFWEYDCFLVISRSLVKASSNAMFAEKTNELKNILIFIFAMEVRFERLRKEFVPMKGMFKLDQRLQSILNNCNSQMDKLSNDIVCDELSKLDLLRMKQNELMKLLNKKYVFDAFMNLYSTLENQSDIQYYNYVLRFHIGLALKKKRLLYSAKKVLSESFRNFLHSNNLMNMTDDILWNILSHYNMRDLKKIQGEGDDGIN